MKKTILALALGLVLSPLGALAQATPAGATIETPARAGSGQVIAGGQVPDEATRVAVLDALRKIYGADAVVDRIEVVGAVAAPPNWSANVQKLITPDLKQVRRGQLQIDGTQMVVTGEVANEATRQKLVSDMAGALNPTYTIRNNLRVPAGATQQQAIDRVLATKTIEFELGSATLSARGRAVLDELVPTLKSLDKRTLAIIGHTDTDGDRRVNLTLSQARADAVKGYLVEKGIDGTQMTTSGVGPDQPVASNDTSEGRARNRRIEMRVAEQK